MRKPDWQHEGISLYLGDCREILPGLAQVDACVTDPPYGIGATTKAFQNPIQRGAAVCSSRDYGRTEWDNEPASPDIISACLSAAKWQVIFGGNYFALPPARCWLVWDKMNGENEYADCELAWTNLDRAVRKLSFRWHGMIRDEAGERVHPTQKPVGVMAWAMSWLPDSRTILDPFMGSGTTGIACLRTGRRFIGIEREPTYFAAAVERFEKALSAPLFDEPKMKQRDLLTA